MFDTNPDVYHIDSSCKVIRYVKVSEEGCINQESFLDFAIVGEKMEEALSHNIIEKLRDDGLDLADCRSQCYHNRSNMAAKYMGIKGKNFKKKLISLCSIYSLCNTLIDSGHLESGSNQVDKFY